MQPTHDQRIEATLAWVLASIQACPGGGSAAWYGWRHRWYRGGWEKAYPETSGYLIPTLLLVGAKYDRADLKAHALGLADWLVSIQMPVGCWNAGAVGGKKPSFFNTAMIVQGMSAASNATSNIKYKLALEKALTWSVEQPNNDGTITQHAYIEGFMPLYYTYALASLCQANQDMDLYEFDTYFKESREYLSSIFEERPSFDMMGFTEPGPASLHTVVYTLQGLQWLSKLYPKDGVWASAYTYYMTELKERFTQTDGRLPGQFSASGADYDFQCPTGVFQLVGTLPDRSQPQAQNWLQPVLQTQNWHPGHKSHGGWPGSWPISGSYMQYKHPNWAAKYFLDLI
jgi:hypothetical protein